MIDHNLSELAFALKKLGGDPYNDLVMNHVVLGVAQRMGLPTTLNFTSADHSPDLSQKIRLISLLTDNSRLPQLPQGTLDYLASLCSQIRRRIWGSKPSELTHAEWLHLLSRIAWNEPLSTEDIRYRRLAKDLIYGVPSSRYDRILAAVV